jgi:hypothetical protein
VNDPRDIFPVRLEDQLQRAGLTNDDVAKVLALDVAEVDEWLDGTDFPCPRKFERLQILLGVTRDGLLT